MNQKIGISSYQCIVIAFVFKIVIVTQNNIYYTAIISFILSTHLAYVFSSTWTLDERSLYVV